MRESLGFRGIFWGEIGLTKRHSSVTWLLPLQHRQRAIARWGLALLFLPSTGSNGRLDFLELPALAFKLAGKHLAEQRHGLKPLVRRREALRNC